MNTSKHQERNKKAWATKDAMKQIYDQNLWGTNESQYYSGEGSHKPELVNPYISAVQSFLDTHKNKLVICDLGCGDFNVGQQLVAHSKKYIAIDIVPDLIERNKRLFKAPNLEFMCLDIAADNLYQGDCAIIRQVFQHLSNTEIQKILEKLTPFKYLIITEHIPQHPFEANTDIISGQGIRLKKKSGVDILKPPFELKIKEKTELLMVSLGQGKGNIVTTLYTL